MTKKEKAKKILLDNGFFSKYHYIIDEFAVQEGGKVRHDADYLAQKIFKLYTELGRIAY